MIDLRVIQKSISYGLPNRTLIPVLVPMFLIISSSVYPALISIVENKEMSTIAEAVAQLKGKDNVDTSGHHADMQISNSRIISPSSPTPIDPSATSIQPNKTPIIQDQGQDLITATTIEAGDLVHVLWDDNTFGNNDILYKRDGADFDPTTVNLSNNAGASISPTIAVSSNNVHVVWEDATPGNNDILYRRSTNGGATFGPIINLSNNAGISVFPAIAISGNNVHVVWQDDTPGNFDILYRRSTDGGASFTEPTKNLSSNAGGSGSPAIAASGIMYMWCGKILHPEILISCIEGP